MKYAFSSPLLASMEHKPRAIQRAYASFNESLGVEQTQLRQQITRTPFLAIPGVGSNLNRMTRIVSVKSFATFKRLQTEAGMLEADNTDLDDENEALYQLCPELEPRVTKNLVFAVIIACLSALQVGYNTGVINVPAQIIKENLLPPTLSQLPGTPTGVFPPPVWNSSAPAPLPSSPCVVDDVQWAMIVSLFCIGGLFGGLSGGYLSDKFGRGKFMLLNNILFISGGVLQAVASSVWVLMLGRFLIGAGCGGVTVVVPLYLGEVSPAQLRGTFGTLYQFTLVSGILIANLLGKPLGTVQGSRLCVCFCEYWWQQQCIYCIRAHRYHNTI